MNLMLVLDTDHLSQFERWSPDKTPAREIERCFTEHERRLVQGARDAGRRTDVLLDLEPQVWQRVG